MPYAGVFQASQSSLTHGIEALLCGELKKNLIGIQKNQDESLTRALGSLNSPSPFRGHPWWRVSPTPCQGQRSSIGRALDL